MNSNVFRGLSHSPYFQDPIIDGDDWSEDDSDYSPEDDFEHELDVLKPSIRSLGLSRNYVKSWTRKDAFREFYQNWKDAIIASFNIDPRSFKPEMKETPNQIQITVHRQHGPGMERSSQELLGFIRFNRNMGSLELTNFKAELSAQNLSLGGTTKCGQDQLAGIHGEGFKLAALVMRRNDHAVRFCASSYYWNFVFKGASASNLYCRLSKAKPEVIERKKQAFAKKMASGARKGLTANMWEDVTVKISKATGNYGKKISEEEFRSWLDVVLDINQPQSTDVVQTEHGDLILDEKFASRIYLKGLHIPGHGPDGREYIFGYNFLRGRINRDRERLMNRSEEAGMLCRIWEQSTAIRGNDVMDQYIKLFREREECADIALAKKMMSIAMAKSIWGRLRASLPGVFFYSTEDGSDMDAVDQANIIRTDLKKEPERLPKALWKILRKYSLARTPQEERSHLFVNSEMVSQNSDPFCVSILRGLKACLALDRRMREITVQFVKGGATEIDMLFSVQEGLLRVHQKWADFQRIHQDAGCEVFDLSQERPMDGGAFSCDHVVEDLFELTLNQVREPLELSQSECVILRRTARERIRQMPRQIKVSSTGRAHELEVCWTGNESGIVFKNYGVHIHYHVSLHKTSTCASKNEELLYQGGPDITLSRSSADEREQASAHCGCASQIASRVDTKAIFKGLDDQDCYFPMVARVESGSFYGMPPAPVAPETATEADATSLAPMTSTGTSPVAHEPEMHVTGADDELPLSFACGSEGGDEDDGEDDEEMVKIPTRKEPVCASPRRSKHIQPGRGQKKMRNIDTSGSLASQQDEKTWQTWHEQQLPEIFSKLIPPSRTRASQTRSLGSCLDARRLDYAFEKGEFARVRMNLEAPEPVDYIIFIHDILSDHGTPSCHLLVTKYSLLKTSFWFSGDHNVAISDREVLLHFEDFDKMGKQDDAETIQVDDIAYAEGLAIKSNHVSDSVEHVVRPPPDPENSTWFCRFAICRSAGPQAVCITPISSGLLLHQDRWRQKKYVSPPSPVVFDLTPNVLGPSEGFSQAGYHIHSGFGFQEDNHLTWKIRHPSAQVYDGPASPTFDDFRSGKLGPPTLAKSGQPRIALVTGDNTSFRLSDENSQMPSVEDFLAPLDISDAATESPLDPDFLVMMMPPALLQASAKGKFSKSVLKLLERRLSVHVKLCPLQSHRLLQMRSTLIVVASSFCASLPWHPDQPFTSVEPSLKVQDLIGDLTFENPRATLGAKSGFLCSGQIPGGSSRSQGGGITKYIYNHQTGRQPPPAGMPIDWNSNTVSVSNNSSKSLVHPIRFDMLTVREIARLQGFKDDFVFYHSETSQYKDVVNALPPVVARRVAETLLHVIRSARVMSIDDPRETTRVDKRLRLDLEEER